MLTARRARIGWLVSMMILLPAAVVGLGAVVQRPDLVSSPVFLDLVGRVGISPVAAAWLGFVLPTALAFVVAAVIRRGRPDDPSALLFGLSVVSLYLIVAGVGTALSEVTAHAVGRFVDVLAVVLLTLGLYLFPNGRFLPRWTRWPAIAMAAVSIAFPDLIGAARSMGTDSPGTFSLETRHLAAAVAVLALGTWLPAQVYRYRRLSTPLEKLQTRWIIFGFALVLIGSLGAILLRAIGIPSRWVAWPLLLAAAGTFILPAAAGLAVLRYRLYEIDRIISRTVTYSILAGLLAALYLATVYAMTRLVPVTGDLAVAGSTLAIAALFNPLRRRVQRVVDRRFNRSRYDAVLMIESFALRLRSGIELGEVLADLQQVLVHTVEPASTKIWLRA
ncbi:MAG TPA: hypothetical protein VM848_04710 [Acidimicrobiia bacterium]|nr:hypothetical protein [Acidimicrobiia bacterium]